MDDETIAARDLVFDVQRDGRAASVGVSGELDAFTAPDLVALCRAIHAQGARDVVFDLTETSFLDSSGLRALVGAQQLFGADGGSVRISRPSEPVLRVLEITGLSGYFFLDAGPRPARPDRAD